MKIINNFYVLFCIFVFCVGVIESKEKYVAPSESELLFRDGFIPYERRENCIQKSKYKVDYDKNDVRKHFAKWNKHNTGTYVYIFEEMGKEGRILFVKNGEIQKSILVNCEREFHGFPFGLYRCKYKLKNVRNKEKSKKYFTYRGLNKSHYLINERFLSVLERDISEKNYCIHPEWQLTYNKKYGYISSLIEKKPNCRCMPIPLKYNRYFYYGLMILPQNIQFTDDIMRIILNKYDKARECEKVLNSKKVATNDNNLTLLEKAVGKEKLECLDKYLVWDKNGTK